MTITKSKLSKSVPLLSFRVSSCIPKRDNMNFTFHNFVNHEVVWSDHRFIQISPPDAAEHFRVSLDVFDCLICCIHEMPYFNDGPVLYKIIYNKCELTLRFVRPLYFFNHFLYFFITTSWSVTLPFAESFKPDSIDFLMYSGNSSSHLSTSLSKIA